MWVAKIFRTLFLLIDAIIYGAVNLVYRLFIMIAETGVFTPESIREFGSRIYVLLGVFMLFKVSFSLITYILNPDEMTDKNKGMGKLLQNFFIVLIGIVAVPYVFQAAYSLQSIILKENVIGSIIMGENANIRSDSEIDNEADYVKRGGELMSFTTLSAFIRLNPNVVGEECANLPVVYSENSSKNIINPVCEDYTDVFETELTSGQTVGSSIIDAYSTNDTAYFTNINLINLRTESIDGEEDWIFEYTYIISSIAGGFMAWILLMFCIDVATRSVKLGFLQLIAPIPIISCVDPKSGKDGVFKKWVNECVKTYVDLFIRLIAIYFALYVVTIIVNGRIYNITTGATQTNIFVIILIIFGALMFAKDLPSLISNITGVKFSGGFTLNPMNKLQQVPIAGAAATNLLGRTAGAIEAMRHDQTGNKWRAAASGWFAAGDALHGKVPLMGAKPGASTVRSIHTGRNAGFEVATGNKMRTHSFVNDFFQEDGKRKIKDLKDNYRAPLQQELNNLALQKQETANAYNRLNEQLQSASSDEERAAIRTKMQQAQSRYQEISKQEAKISGDISVINDQIKDLERAYSIDKSPISKINEVRDSVNAGSYHTDFSPIDYSVPTSGGSTSGPTVGGVDVSGPNANGERTTSSGIIIPGNIDLDK